MPNEQQVFVVDHDARTRRSICALVEASGFPSREYASATQFLADGILKGGCVIADIRMPDMSGLDLQEEICRRGIEVPLIIITGQGDVSLAVQAMKRGVVDFIEKPFDDKAFIGSVRRALKIGQKSRSHTAETRAAQTLLALLTPRETSVLAHLVNGLSNKMIGCELGISPRTVEIHRAHIIYKLHASGLSDLVRITVSANDSEQRLRHSLYAA
jgi:two-component system response regulator FixJ